MKQSGFSLVETMVVLGIILVVAAISVPAVWSVRRKGDESLTRSNLRQLWLAIQLYREDWGGAEVGDMHAMGLPTSQAFHGIVERTGLRPPKRPAANPIHWYYYMVPELGVVETPRMLRDWETHVATCGSQAVVVADFTFNDFNVLESNPYKLRKGFGVTLGGSVVAQERGGAPVFNGWWLCPGVSKP
ncbi:MAG: prepilin-type N-terminal cleavage/methylation domain-containing protein [Fimbriimonadaceae bacterium]|nr:prepilin-type N-terminal cleavage/methylation domain-containing protein [Fimbriimonadaceae bacterium]